MNLVDDLIMTRIMLSNLCDGFSKTNSSKNNTLSIKLKVLFLLEDKDQTPAELISMLCIAKSNLANLLRSLMSDGLVESYRNIDNSRNINYHLTESGKKELLDYKNSLREEVACKIEGNPQSESCIQDLTKNLSQIIEILERIQNND